MKRSAPHPDLQPIRGDEDAAYCAAAWASGQTQREIADILRYKGASNISFAIGTFISKYGDRSVQDFADRQVFCPKTLVPGAIRNFLKARGGCDDRH